VRYISLIEDSSQEIDQYSNYADDGEDGAGAYSLFRGLGSDAGVFGEDFEVVGTLVWRGPDECQGGLGCEGVFVAVEGDEG
jgi:hypothetical protein